MAAVDSTLAMIEFNPEGVIQRANGPFLKAMKYRTEEVLGRHHRMFVDRAFAQSPSYQTFWENLRNGVPQLGEFKRVAKDGSEVWLNATYTPVADKGGAVVKIIKLAIDVTEQKMKLIDYEGQIAAINRSAAVVEFDTQGNILTANDIFLDLMGYQLGEIQGRHHRMFVPEKERNADAYQNFWQKLGRGESTSAEFKRLAKDGREVWIKGSYNAIIDLEGRPVKVVKYAYDVTEQKLARVQKQ